MKNDKSNDDETLEDTLSLKKESGWSKIDDSEREEVFDFGEEYKDFIGNVKTERESVKWIIDEAKKSGYKDIEEIDKNNLETGDKFYVNNRNKGLALVRIGEKDILEGARMVVSHIDAPRLDLKPNPLYEESDSELALFKTHYYGGVKKYQWINRPLAIHGVVMTEDGEKIKITIGEDDEDPVFIISDLLPHLAKKAQGDKKLLKGIEGEELNVIVGGIPIESNDKINKKIKTNVLDKLNNEYGITEEDFNSADIELVPANKPKDVGFDRSMISSYGHDDRICAYTSLQAILNSEQPRHTSIAFFYDKEEIGSEGNTGAQSAFMDLVMTKIMETEDEYSYGKFNEMMYNSKAISADVSAAVNPTFKSVHEMKNAAKASHGIVVSKYTGSGGKYMSSEAQAEYVSEIRQIFNENDVEFQLAELGKVDEGGGGTIAKFFARYGIEVIDIGPGLLGMHSPYEIVSKFDLWSAYKGYKSFLEN